MKIRTDDPTRWLIFSEMYLERLEARHAHSDYPGQVRRVLDRFTEYQNLQRAKLADIKDFDLEQYIYQRQRDRWRGKAPSNRTLNNEIQILNTCFALAGPKEHRGPGRKNWGLIDAPPFCEPLPDYDRNPVTVGPDQVAAFLEATAHATTPTWRGMNPRQFWLAAILLDMITGLRRGALLRVHRPPVEVFEGRREIVVPPEISKTRREQTIALGSHESVFRILASLPSRVGEPLLPWRSKHGKPMTLAHFNHAMAKFQRAAGIPEELRLKTKHLRSTVATELAESFSDATAKKRLGHTPGSNTLDKHYKGRRVSAIDHQASDMLVAKFLPSLETPPPYRIVG